MNEIKLNSCDCILWFSFKFLKYIFTVDLNKSITLEYNKLSVRSQEVNKFQFKIKSFENINF
jgi:hypothetical protein